MVSGCGKQAGQHIARQANPDALHDKPISVFQHELLDLAFESASAMPVNPHIKNRSRAQDVVVQISLELNQPRRALDYVEQIGNWRRGAGYADLAFYCARNGCADDVPYFLDLAAQISEAAEDWRKDRIRVKIAKVHSLLGNAEKADEFEAGVVDSESGKVAGIEAMRAGEEAFGEQMNALDQSFASENFDIMQNALGAYAELFNRFYDRAEQRTLVEEKMKSSWVKMPVFIQIDFLMRLAEFALDHEDQNKALALVNEAQALLDGAAWPVEHRIRLMAKLSGLRFRAGDTEKARADADAAFALYDSEGEIIINIYRPDTLRPLAEAYQVMGDTAAALGVYKKAVEESVVNPNSRPRAEDLSATLSSMALYAVEPDTEFWTRIRQIKQGLGDPW